MRARLEAEDAQRVLLGALNGLAGLMLLDGKGAEAVATFREVLSIGAAPLPPPWLSSSKLIPNHQPVSACFGSLSNLGLAPFNCSRACCRNCWLPVGMWV